MHYLLIYDVVEDYVNKRRPHREAHFSHLKKAYDRGDVILGGALSEPAESAILLFSRLNPVPREEFARTDPSVLNGLVTKWKVRIRMTVIGEGSSPV